MQNNPFHWFSNWPDLMHYCCVFEFNFPMFCLFCIINIFKIGKWHFIYWSVDNQLCSDCSMLLTKITFFDLLWQTVVLFNRIIQHLLISDLISFTLRCPNFLCTTKQWIKYYYLFFVCEKVGGVWIFHIRFFWLL